MKMRIARRSCDNRLRILAPLALLALATAQKHGGDKILEKTPDTVVSYACDWNRNTNELVWHVMYGTSRESAKLTVAVNASTGDFIRVEK